MIFDYRGSMYSISDPNEHSEYVVAKVNPKNRKVEAAKIITGKSKRHIKTQIMHKGFNDDNFKDLPIN